MNQPERNLYEDWLEKLVLTSDEKLSSVLNETFVFIYSSIITEDGSKSSTKTTSKSMIQLLNHAILRLRSTKVQLDVNYLTSFLTNRNLVWTINFSSPVYTTLPLVLSIVIENWKATCNGILTFPNVFQLAETLVNAFDWFRVTGVAPTALLLVCQLFMLETKYPNFCFSQYFAQAIQNLDQSNKDITLQWCEKTSLKNESLPKLKALGAFIDTLVYFLILPPLNCSDHSLPSYNSFFASEQEVAFWKNQLNKFLLNKTVWNEMRYVLISYTNSFPSHVAYIPLLLVSHDPYTLIRDEAREHLSCFGTHLNAGHPIILSRLFQYLIPNLNSNQIKTHYFLDTLQKIPLKCNRSLCTNELVMYDFYKELLKAARTQFVNISCNTLTASIFQVYGIPMILNVLKNDTIWEKDPTTYLLETLDFLMDYFMSTTPTILFSNTNCHYNYLNKIEEPLNSILCTKETHFDLLESFVELSQNVQECLIESQGQLLTSFVTWKDGKDFQVLISFFKLTNLLMEQKTATFSLLRKCAKFVYCSFCLLVEFIDTWDVSFDHNIDKSETLKTLLECMQILKKSIGVLYSDISSKDIREIFFTEMKKTMKPFLIKSSLAKREILNLIQLLNKDIENPYILLILLVFQWDADNEVAESATTLLTERDLSETSFVSFFHDILLNFYVSDIQQAAENLSKVNDIHYLTCYQDIYTSKWDNLNFIQENFLRFNGIITYDALIHCLCFAIILAFRKSDSSHASLPFFERKAPLFTHFSGHETNAVPLLFFHVTRSLHMLTEISLKKKQSCEYLCHVAYLFLLEQFLHASHNPLPKYQIEYIIPILMSSYRDTINCFFNEKERDQWNNFLNEEQIIKCTHLYELLKKKTLLYEWVTYRSFIYSVSTQNISLLLACDVFYQKSFPKNFSCTVRMQVESFIKEMKQRPPMLADAYFFCSLHSQKILFTEQTIHLLESFTHSFFQAVFNAFCGTYDILHPYYIYILNHKIYTQSAFINIPFLSRMVGEKKTWVDILKVIQHRISAMLHNSFTIQIHQTSQTIFYYEELWSFLASLFKLLSDCQTVKEELLNLQLKWIPNCCFQSLKLFKNGSVEHCFAITRFFKEIFQSSQDYSCSSLNQAHFFFFHLLILHNCNKQFHSCTCLHIEKNIVTAQLTEEAIQKEALLKNIHTLLLNMTEPVVKNVFCITNIDICSISCIILNCIMGNEEFHPMIILHIEILYSIMTRNVFNTNAIISLSCLRGLLSCIKAMHENNQFPLFSFLKNNGYQLCLAFQKAYQIILQWKISKAYTLQCPTYHYYTHFIQIFHSIVECIQLLEHFHLIFLFFLPFLEKYSKTLTLSLPYIFHENHLTDFLFNMSYATILLQDAHESLVIFLYHTNYEIQCATQRLCYQLFGGNTLRTILIQSSLCQENVHVFCKTRCFSILCKNLKKFFNVGNTLLVQTLKDILTTPICWEEDAQAIVEIFMMDIFSVYDQCSKDFINHQCDAHTMDIYEDLMSAFRQAIIHAFSKNLLLRKFLKYLNDVLQLYSSNSKIINCCFGMLYTWMETFEKTVVCHINEITVFLFTIYSQLMKCYQNTTNSSLSNACCPEICFSETLFSTYPLSKPLIEFLAFHTTLQVLKQLVKTFIHDIKINQSPLLGELTLVFLAMINTEIFQTKNNDCVLDILFTTLFPLLFQFSFILKKNSYDVLIRLIPFVSPQVLMKTLRNEMINKLFVENTTNPFENICLFRCQAGDILYKIYKLHSEIFSSNILSKSFLIVLCFIFKHCTNTKKSSWLDLWNVLGTQNIFEINDPLLIPLLLTNLCQLLQSQFQEDLILFTNTLVSILKNIEIKRGYKVISFIKKQTTTPTCSCSIISESFYEYSCSVCLWNHLSKCICQTIFTKNVEIIPIPFIQVCIKLASLNILDSSLPLLTFIFEKVMTCEKKYHQGLLLEALRCNFLSQCVLLELCECNVLCDHSIQSLLTRLEQQIMHQILAMNASSTKSVTECYDLDPFWSCWVSLIKLNEKFLSLKLVLNNSVDFLNMWINWVKKNPVRETIAPCTALTSLLWYLKGLKSNGPYYIDKNDVKLKQSCSNMLTFCTKTLKSLIIQFDEVNEDHAILTYLRLEKTILFCYESFFINEPMHPLVESLAFYLHQNPTFLKDTEEIFYLCTKKMHFYRQNKKILDSIFDLTLQYQTNKSSQVHSIP